MWKPEPPFMRGFDFSKTLFSGRIYFSKFSSLEKCPRNASYTAIIFLQNFQENILRVTRGKIVSTLSGVCGRTYMHHKTHGIPHGALPVGWIVFLGFAFRTLFGLAVHHMGIYVLWHAWDLFHLAMRCRRSSRGSVTGFKKATILTDGLFVGL